MPDFSIASEANGPATVVRMTGWAGLGSQAELELAVTRLSAVAHTLVVLDLSKLEGMSSLAVGQLVLLHRAVTKRGGHLRVGGASTDVQTVLVRCKIDALIPVFPSLESALAAPCAV